MAEFCRKCFRELFPLTQYEYPIVSGIPEYCESCGEKKPYVIRVCSLDEENRNKIIISKEVAKNMETNEIQSITTDTKPKTMIAIQDGKYGNIALLVNVEDYTLVSSYIKRFYHEVRSKDEYNSPINWFYTIGNTLGVPITLYRNLHIINYN